MALRCDRGALPVPAGGWQPRPYACKRPALLQLIAYRPTLLPDPHQHHSRPSAAAVGRIGAACGCMRGNPATAALRPAARRASHVTAASPGSAPGAEVDTDPDYTLEDWREMGPAFKATLRLLEWPRLCEHVADFASTTVGKRLCRSITVPESQAESERLQAETRCAAEQGRAGCPAGGPSRASGLVGQAGAGNHLYPRASSCART